MQIIEGEGLMNNPTLDFSSVLSEGACFEVKSGSANFLTLMRKGLG